MILNTLPLNILTATSRRFSPVWSTPLRTMPKAPSPSTSPRTRFSVGISHFASTYISHSAELEHSLRADGVWYTVWKRIEKITNRISEYRKNNWLTPYTEGENWRKNNNLLNVTFNLDYVNLSVALDLKDLWQPQSDWTEDILFPSAMGYFPSSSKPTAEFWFLLGLQSAGHLFEQEGAEMKKPGVSITAHFHLVPTLCNSGNVLPQNQARSTRTSQATNCLRYSVI